MQINQLKYNFNECNNINNKMNQHILRIVSSTKRIFHETKKGFKKIKGKTKVENHSCIKI